MEDVWENVDKKYDIIEKKGFGASSVVYLVKDSTTKKTYAAKILKKQNKVFNDEIEMLNILKEEQNPYILNLVNKGTGNVTLKDKDLKEKQYIILEYASKGSLFNYIYLFPQGLKKEHAKVFFYKILQGILCIHNKGICHRDLKLENILLDENFNPKIADFGYAAFNSKKLKDGKGTPGYAAPENYKNNLYNGFKADIFSLGVILFNLYTGNSPFQEAKKEDKAFIYFILGEYEVYWTKFTKAKKGHEKFKDLKDFEKFKDLVNKMISYNPKDRPTITEILESELMKEAKDLNKDQKIEKEIIEEFLRVEPKINEVLELNATNSISSSLNFDKGNDDNSKEYFDLSLKPKYAKTGLGINFIKIQGDLNPAKFMNNLANKIDQEEELKDKCKFNQSNKTLKFNITFYAELEEEKELPKELQEKLDKLGIQENEEINSNILKKDCIIQCQLYQSLNGGHILKFSKKCGYLEDYYNKLKIIILLVKKIV